MCILCVGANVTLAADTLAARRTLRADDFYKIQTLTDPQVSPDGQWVAYVVTTNDREADEPRSAVWMVSWDGKQQIQLTNAAKETHAPRWSPDGHYLAFISTPAESEHGQVMVLDRRGGEARVLTSVSDEIGGYAWSPDGRRLVLVMTQGDEQTAGPSAGTKAAKRPKPIVIDALHFKEDEDGYLGVGHGRHLYLFDVASKMINALTTDPASNENLPSWSPDGRQIAFVKTREKGPDPDGMEAIEVIDARAGSTARQVVRAYAPNSQQLAWSPDGTLLAYLQGIEPRYNAYIQDRLAVVPVTGGQTRPLSDTLDRAVTSYAFSPDGTSIDMVIEDDGTAYPARIDLRTGFCKPTIKGSFVVSALAAAGGNVAVLYADDNSPAEVNALEAGKLRRLTTHNDALLAELRLGAVEDIRFTSRDGTPVHGLIVKPPSFVAGQKYPTILMIHGGPNGQDGHSLAYDEYQFRRQLLAANGFVVVGVNYRGSSGRGSAFARAIVADWGHKEVDDVLAAVDHLVSAGIADPARLGIGGWSYGGILTDYIIASDRRFKAAFSGAGSANQISMYGSDQYQLQYNNELGGPWKSAALWIKLSYPFFHADRIHTPTLFMGGEKDFNVPIAGSEQMYQALRTLGIPTQLVVYPDQYHSLTRPSFLKDRLERLTAWFSHYLLPAIGKP